MKKKGRFRVETLTLSNYSRKQGWKHSAKLRWMSRSSSAMDTSPPLKLETLRKCPGSLYILTLSIDFLKLMSGFNRRTNLGAEGWGYCTAYSGPILVVGSPNGPPFFCRFGRSQSWPLTEACALRTRSRSCGNVSSFSDRSMAIRACS